MAQVKFYSVSALPANPNAGGVFFVDGGELYKGSSRFGANKVFTVPANTTITGETAAAKLASALTAAGVSAENANAISGDILTGYGAAKVFNGSTWVDLGADTAITDDLESRVSAIESIVDASTSTVTAATGNFTNLNVSDTATFSATTVSATTLTVGGVSVNNIAASTSTSTANGVAVTVSTANGGVKDVTVALTKADLNTFLGTTDVADKSVTTTVRAAASALDTALPTESAVRAAIDTAIGNMGQVMHFAGAGTALPASAAAGDVYVFTADATDSSGYKSGQEVVYKGDNGTYNASNWEVIGDQNSYALNAYAPGGETVTAGTTTLPSAVHAIASAVDTLNTNASLKASVGTGTATASYGVSGEVVLSANAQPTLSVAVAPVTTSAGITSTATTSLATAAAIADYVDGKIGALGTAASMNYSTEVANDSTLPTGAAVTTFVGSQITTSINALSSNVSSSNQTGLTVSVVETSGVITGVQAELVWLSADGTAL